MSWLLSPPFFQSQHEEWWWWIHRVVFSPGSICCVALIQQPSWFGCDAASKEGYTRLLVGVFKVFDRRGSSASATQENISQLRLMYQALLDPPGGLTGPHVVLGEKKRNTVHTLAKQQHKSELKGTKERRTKQVIDDLFYLDPWKMDHVKCCWLEFFPVLSHRTRIYESNTH